MARKLNPMMAWINEETRKRIKGKGLSSAERQKVWRQICAEAKVRFRK